LVASESNGMRDKVSPTVKAVRDLPDRRRAEEAELNIERMERVLADCAAKSPFAIRSSSENIAGTNDCENPLLYSLRRRGSSTLRRRGALWLIG